MALKPSTSTALDPEKRSFSPRVFVIQEVRGVSVHKALDFGSVEVVLSWDDEASLLNTPMIVHKIRRKLATFTRYDWLILLGNPVSIGIASAIAADITGGVYKVLKWDKQETRYIPIEINLNKVGY